MCITYSVVICRLWVTHSSRTTQGGKGSFNHSPSIQLLERQEVWPFLAFCAFPCGNQPLRWVGGATNRSFSKPTSVYIYIICRQKLYIYIHILWTLNPMRGYMKVKKMWSASRWSRLVTTEREGSFSAFWGQLSTHVDVPGSWSLRSPGRLEKPHAIQWKLEESMVNKWLTYGEYMDNLWIIYG